MIEGKNEKKLAAKLWANTVESKELQKALLRLSLPCQRMLFFRFWEFMTIEEISKEMQMSWDEVDHRIDAALLSLRKSLLRRKPQKHFRNGAA